MTNTMMYSEYELHSASVGYIVGFQNEHKVYMLEVPTLADMAVVETASRNQGEALRLRIRKAQKVALIECGAICLGTDDFLTNEKYNKGEMFEKMVTEYFGQVWVKDNIPFWVQGDICVNGRELQIKFDGASIITSALLAKLGA